VRTRGKGDEGSVSVEAFVERSLKLLLEKSPNL